MKENITLIYKKLLKEYGPRGWLPVYSLKNTGGRDGRGYLVEEFPPGTVRNLSLRESTRFEIAVGAILTQNKVWTNVEKALANLIRKNLLDPKKIRDIKQDELAEHIRPSGYYNQKVKKLKILTYFLLKGDFFNDGNIPLMEDLLELWGIGLETADSILLYAYNIPVFVVDAYTKRIFKRLGFLGGS